MKVNWDLILNDLDGDGGEQMGVPIKGIDVDENDDDISQENKHIVDRLKQIMLEGGTSDGILFNKVNKRSLRAQTERVNSLVKFVKTKNITETKKLINAASVWVVDQLGLKKFEIGRRKEP